MSRVRPMVRRMSAIACPVANSHRPANTWLAEFDAGGFEGLADFGGVNRCSDSLSIEQFRSHDGVER